MTHISKQCYFQATFKGWMDIMYAAVDSREVVIIYLNVSIETLHLALNKLVCCTVICISTVYEENTFRILVSLRNLSLLFYIHVYFVFGELQNYVIFRTVVETTYEKGGITQKKS